MHFHGYLYSETSLIRTPKIRVPPSTRRQVATVLYCARAQNGAHFYYCALDRTTNSSCLSRCREKSIGKKRCRRVVTLEKKLEIISQFKKVKLQRFASSLFDIPKSTVAGV